MNFSSVLTVDSSTVSSECVQMSDVFERPLLRHSLRYLLENMDWLEEELGSFDDDYLIIDCPGAASSNIHLFHSF